MLTCSPCCDHTSLRVGYQLLISCTFESIFEFFSPPVLIYTYSSADYWMPSPPHDEGELDPDTVSFGGAPNLWWGIDLQCCRVTVHARVCGSTISISKVAV